jgi:hypothetical protein
LAAIAIACATAGVGCKSSTVRSGENQSVTATTPRSLTIQRGGTADLQVTIDRNNVSGPVEVSLSQLPKGVDADPSSMKVESTVATFVLKASSSAPIVDQQAIAVTVEDPDGREALHYVNLTVRP